MLKNRTYNWRDMLRLPFRAAPIPVVLLLLAALIQAVIPTFVLAFATAALVDTAMQIFQHQSPISAIYFPLALLIAAIGITTILDNVIRLLTSRIAINMERNYTPAILEARANLSYQHIEDEDSWELVELTDDLLDTLKGGLGAVRTVLRNIVAVIAVFTLIVLQVWWAALALIVLSVPLFWLAVRAGKRSYDAEVEALKEERRYSYFSEEVLTNRDAVDERTLFGYSDDVTGRYYQHFKAAHKIQLDAELQMQIAQKSASIVMAIISVLIILSLVNPVLTGQLSAGMFMGIVSAIFAVIEMLSSSMQPAIAKFSKGQEYLESLTELLSLSRTPGATDLPDSVPMEFERLEFRNVTFKYPTGESEVLHNLSFDLDRGKHYAFVGANGAGKTTIAKLLTGLYDGYDGEILINGKELRSYPISTVKALFSVVQQDFARYEVSLADNIALGAAAQQVPMEQLTELVNAVPLGSVVSELPDGLKTHLGKIDEDGIDLSGGQWQQVAITRSLLSPAPIKILDEPTAALDPVAESRIYQEFENLMHGKTTIMISHRLGSTKLADKIFVIADGNIAEQGTHDELMAENGIYAQMFRAQSDWYL